MNSEPTEVRIAQARDPRDLAGAVHVLLRSFAGRKNVRLGERYVWAFLQAFASDPSRSLLVARVPRGDVVGFVAGEPGDRQAERYRALRFTAAAALLRRPWLLLDVAILRMAWARLTRDAGESIEPGTWFLAMTGTDPDVHGLGVGRLLLRSFEEEVRRRGFERATLYCQDSNARARALYERCGWKPGGFAPPRRVRYERMLIDAAVRL